MVLIPPYARLILFIFLCLSMTAKSQTVRLITIGPGEAFWSVYGHTALAIDDQVYAFGYFNFAEDNLFKAFLLNDMNYSMGISELAEELYWAEQGQRQFTEQVLNLSPLAVQRLKRQLDQHYLPENRRYQYDYFSNNCATKIRDFLNQATDGRLYQHAKMTSSYSYADLTLPAYHQSAMRFGLAMGYGYQAYKKISYWQAMAFPLAIREFVSHQMTDTVVSESVIYQPPSASWPFLKNHAFFLILLSVLILGWLIKPLRAYVVTTWFYLVSLMGVTLLLLWFVLPHPIADGNFNVLLANPLLFLAVLRKKSQLMLMLLVLSQIVWLVFAWYWQAWYLWPLMIIHVFFLGQQFVKNRTD